MSLGHTPFLTVDLKYQCSLGFFFTLLRQYALYSSMMSEAFVEIYGIATALNWRICRPAQENTHTFFTAWGYGFIACKKFHKAS